MVSPHVEIPMEFFRIFQKIKISFFEFLNKGFSEPGLENMRALFLLSRHNGSLNFEDSRKYFLKI
jgi:hypothetical protein